MTDYDSPKRILPFPLKEPVVFSRTTQEDVDCEASSFVWPEDSDERVPILFSLSLNEYNVLASAVDVGSDIAYGEDALRVSWLWLRNARCNVDLCALIASCITNSLETQAALQGLIDSGILELPQTGNTNIYPPLPADDAKICNAAAYIVAQVRDLIVNIFADLATIDPDDVMLALLNQQGWSAEAVIQVVAYGYANLANEVAILADFDASSDDIKCKINQSTLDRDVLIDWIETFFAGNVVLMNMLTYAVSAAANDGRWSLWATIGTLQTGADCDDCDSPSLRIVIDNAAPNMLEFISNVDPDTSIWRVHRRYSGHYATGSYKSPIGENFYLQDYSIISGTSWNIVATGAGNLWGGAWYELEDIPCYRATTIFGFYGVDSTTVDEVAELTLSRNPPCPLWVIQFSYGNILSQTPVRIELEGELIPSDSNNYNVYAHIVQAGLQFHVTSITYSVFPISGASYFVLPGHTNVAGYVPIGANITGLYARDPSPFTVVIEGYYL